MIMYIDYVDEENYDIKGEAYKNFIEKCFKYSTYFSLVTPRNYKETYIEKYKYIYEKLKPFLFIKRERVEKWPGNPWGNGYPDFYVYCCCEETKNILQQECDSLFSWWGGKPEDLSFYYDDNKIFLYTITHEGDCIISCTPEIFKEFKDFNYWFTTSETDFLEETYF